MKRIAALSVLGLIVSITLAALPAQAGAKGHGKPKPTSTPACTGGAQFSRVTNSEEGDTRVGLAFDRANRAYYAVAYLHLLAAPCAGYAYSFTLVSDQSSGPVTCTYTTTAVPSCTVIEQKTDPLDGTAYYVETTSAPTGNVIVLEATGIQPGTTYQGVNDPLTGGANPLDAAVCASAAITQQSTGQVTDALPSTGTACTTLRADPTSQPNQHWT